MTSGDNQTHFDAARFLLGTSDRAVVAAPAFGSGAQATSRCQARWEAYNRDELEAFLDLTEHKLRRASLEIENLRMDNARLSAAQRHTAMHRI